MMEDKDYIVETLDALEQFAKQHNKEELLKRIRRTQLIYRQEVAEAVT